LNETDWVVLTAAAVSAAAVTLLARRVVSADPSQPDRMIGELRVARWGAVLLAALGGISVGLASGRPDLGTAHIDAALGAVFVGLGGIILHREPRDGLAMAAGGFVLHALVSLAHRPGWLSADVAPHWYSAGYATFDVYLAGLLYWVRRR
jgi:hypothetical protein